MVQPSFLIDARRVDLELAQARTQPLSGSSLPAAVRGADSTSIPAGTLTLHPTAARLQLQDLVDELALTLGRSVLIDDLDYCVIAASPQGDDIDELRTQCLLRRTPPRAARDFVDRSGVRGARTPMTLSFQEVGGLDRLAVPVWDNDEQVAILWIIVEGLPKLQRAEFRALDAGVVLAGRLIQAQRHVSPRSDAQSAAEDLLAPLPRVRREALDKLVRAHSLQRSADYSVRAALLPDDTSALQAEMLMRAVQSRGRHSQLAMRASSNAVYFVGDSDSDADDAIRTQAAELGLFVSGIGIAPLTPSTTDLLGLSEHALATALIASQHPHYGGHATTKEAASWLLIAEASGRPERVPWFSPAAQLLLEDADPLRRQTIETYLDHAGRVRDTCEELHIHRTSLYYRLETMPDIVREALNDGLARSAMHVALKIGRLRVLDHAARFSAGA